MTSEKIKRIRLHKLVGKIVYGLILATLIIVILINLNCAMKIQAGQLMWIRQDIDELKNTEAEIADLSDFNLTEEERTLVERIVASESRGESVEGMAAVAQVIRDRSQLWGLTVTEVCLAPGQFASPYNGEISPEIVQAVWAVFDEGMSILEIPTTHFHADYVSPYWADGKVSRGQISRHLFYGE